VAHFTNPLTPNGAIVQLYVGMSEARLKAMAVAGQNPPTPLLRDFLVDTGAGTAVDIQVLQSLGLSPTGSSHIHTPSTGQTPQQAFQYDVGLILPHSGAVKVFGSVPVIASDFSKQNFHGLLGGTFWLSVS